MSEIRKGDIAINGEGATGLITNPKPQPFPYDDGSPGFAYVGIQLTDRTAPIGSLWFSRKPLLVSHIEQPEEVESDD